VKLKPMQYLLITPIAVAALLEVALLTTGYRILVYENYLPQRPGISGVPRLKFGRSSPENLNIYAREPKFECTYFTGRKTVNEEVSAVYYDECPFIWSMG